jgi:imidazolonepropionase-like amidohydrolase
MECHPKLERGIAACVARVTRGAWKLGSVQRAGAGLALGLEGMAGPLTLEVQPADPARPSYRTVGTYAYSYRGTSGPLGRPQQRILDATIAALGALLARVPAELLAAPGKARAEEQAFPTPFHRYHLESELPIPDAAIAAFRRDGHVLLRGALTRDVVLAARPLLLAALRRAWPKETVPLEDRRDAYSQAFVQVVNIGLDDPAVRAFTNARRLGKIAADLMGVSGARIFSEDWLLKEPGARLTPWHQDAAVFPFDAEASLTIWIPIQDVPPGMGLVRFARGSHRFGIAPVENINDVSDAMFARIIAEQGFAIDECPPVRVGDISVHDGRTIHAASANDSAELRVVLALHCFADGAVVKEPETPSMAHQLADLAPELRPGEAAAGRKWPLIYSRRSSEVGRFLSSPAEPAYHVRATVLPDGSAPVDIWIQGGRFRTAPISGAQELAHAGGFAIAGLVDAHSHVSWPHDRDTPAHTAAFMDGIRANQAATGVTLLRDMGAAGDEVLALGDRPGLPRIHASGMLVLRFDHFPFTPTPPAALRSAFLTRVERGAGWIKVFSDWSEDYAGKENVGFTAHDEVTYPLAVLADAVAAAHEAGARVAAHCFTRAGAEVAIAAQCDSLEHGWGIDEALIAEMAARGIAWVPLLGIAAPMWQSAQRFAQSDRAAWIESSMERLSVLLPLAHARGVPIFAGTDWFPEVTVADEIRALHAAGLSVESALAAGTWAVRAWLGDVGLEDSAPADLVIYQSDPRLALDVLEQPALVMIGGRRVDVAAARVRPKRLAWADRRRSDEFERGFV